MKAATDFVASYRTAASCRQAFEQFKTI